MGRREGYIGISAAASCCLAHNQRLRKGGHGAYQILFIILDVVFDSLSGHSFVSTSQTHLISTGHKSFYIRTGSNYDYQAVENR